jgi:uncharacterized protein (DUF1684 family)
MGNEYQEHREKVHSQGERMRDHKAVRGLLEVTRPALVILILSGCTEVWPDPAPIETATLLAEHEEWRGNREASLVTPPGGAVLWMGLWPIPQGATEFGSDDELPMVLPLEDSPGIAGTLRRSGQEVTFGPAPGSPVRVRSQDPDNEDSVIETLVTQPLVLENDRSGNTTVLALGSLGLRVHSEPGTDRLWLRAWDEDAPERETFTLPDYFPVQDRWRVAARFEPYDEPVILRFPDVTGGEVEYRAPGELHFRMDGEEHSLIATAGENSSTYFLIMWDSTAVENTYQGGRYLRTELADEDGWTTIDFNRAYNAPCVFTAFSVCALPPRENWLGLYVSAGEQRPETAAH